MKMEGLEVRGHLTSGSGKYWVYGPDPPCLRCVSVQKSRVGVAKADDPRFIFVENRSYSRIAKYGLAALAVLRLPNSQEWKIILCLATGPEWMVYLEWLGSFSQMELLYQKKWGKVKGLLKENKVLLKFAETPKGKKARRPDRPELFFVNMVHSPPGFPTCAASIRHDTRSPRDGSLGYSAMGPDVLLGGGARIPHKMVATARETANIVRPPHLGKQAAFSSSQEGDFLLVSERGLQDKDISLAGGPLFRGRPLVDHKCHVEVPYMTCDPRGSRTALLSPAAVMEWAGKSEGMSLEDYDSGLASISQGDLEHLVVDYRSSTVLFLVSVPGYLPDNVGNIPCSGIQHFGKHQVLLRGTRFSDVVGQVGDCHILSAGGEVLPRELATLPLETLTCLVDTYSTKGGFGGRRRSPNVGSNTYQGSRCTSATQENPVCGAYNLPNTDYYRHTYQNVHTIVALNPLMQVLGGEIAKIARRYHPVLINFLEGAVEAQLNNIFGTTCVNKIVTNGILGWILSFANAPHRDSGDIYCRTIQELYRASLAKEGHPTYIMSWLERFGEFDCPTTCGYANLGSPPPGGQVYQFFSMGGLSATAQVGPRVVHCFFGGRMCHNTTVAVLVCDGRVYLRSPSFACLAWGAGKPPKK